MKTLQLGYDEFVLSYPVDAESAELGWGNEHELPDDLADELVATWHAFKATHDRLRAYWKAVDRDEHAHDHDIEINKRRLARGRRRQYRRPHPARV